MKVDPVASLRIWAIDVNVGDRVLHIPPLPASDWFPVLAEGRPMRVLDLVVSNPTDPDNIDDLILSGAVTVEDLSTALEDTVEEITGREPMAAYILAMVAADSWPVIGGDLARRGFRWDRTPIGAALDAIYAVLMARLSEDNAKKLNALLDRPAPGKKADRKKAVADFESMAGPRPAPVPATGARSGSAHPRTPLRPRRGRPVARSSAPRTPPAQRAGSGLPATPGNLPGVAEPTSDTAPPLPPPSR